MIKPRFSKWDHASGEWIFGLDKEDLEKVRLGYACSRCLEDYGGVFLTRCPVCKSDTLVMTETPREWSK